MRGNLPTLADGYVRTVNESDPAGFIKLFAADAIVDDAGREFRGIEEIKRWSDSDIFAANVTFEVLDQSQTGDALSITTKVDGDFDRTGLPDPVIIVNSIRANDGKISRLVCRLG